MDASRRGVRKWKTLRVIEWHGDHIVCLYVLTKEGTRDI